MNKKLYKRLLTTALLSSPILALYGITPIYFFNKIPFNPMLAAGIGILINVVIFWAVNILILARFANRKPWFRYSVSYVAVLLIHSSFLSARLYFYHDVFPNEIPISEQTFILYPFLAIIAINTIILIMCHLVVITATNEKAKLEIEQLKVTNLEAQQKALMQQLQPHFLFNTLSVLKSLIKENPGEAEQYAMKLSAFLRYTFDAHNNGLIALRDELKFTNDYIELQKVRFENSFVCEIDIPHQTLAQRIPAYALQTLVENAIKHNAFTDKKPLHIKIKYEKDAIKVCNNKLPGKPEHSTGTGLKNLNDRYKIVASQELYIANKQDEFCVTAPLLNNQAV